MRVNLPVAAGSIVCAACVAASVAAPTIVANDRLAPEISVTQEAPRQSTQAYALTASAFNLNGFLQVPTIVMNTFLVGNQSVLGVSYQVVQAPTQAAIYIAQGEPEKAEAEIAKLVVNGQTTITKVINLPQTIINTIFTPSAPGLAAKAAAAPSAPVGASAININGLLQVPGILQDVFLEGNTSLLGVGYQLISTPLQAAIYVAQGEPAKAEAAIAGLQKNASTAITNLVNLPQTILNTVFGPPPAAARAAAAPSAAVSASAFNPNGLLQVPTILINTFLTGTTSVLGVSYQLVSTPLQAAIYVAQGEPAKAEKAIADLQKNVQSAITNVANLPTTIINTVFPPTPTVAKAAVSPADQVSAAAINPNGVLQIPGILEDTFLTGTTSVLGVGYQFVVVPPQAAIYIAQGEPEKAQAALNSLAANTQAAVQNVLNLPGEILAALTGATVVAVAKESESEVSLLGEKADKKLLASVTTTDKDLSTSTVTDLPKVEVPKGDTTVKVKTPLKVKIAAPATPGVTEKEEAKPVAPVVADKGVTTPVTPEKVVEKTDKTEQVLDKTEKTEKVVDKTVKSEVAEKSEVAPKEKVGPKHRLSAKDRLAAKKKLAAEDGTKKDTVKSDVTTKKDADPDKKADKPAA